MKNLDNLLSFRRKMRVLVLSEVILRKKIYLRRKSEIQLRKEIRKIEIRTKSEWLEKPILEESEKSVSLEILGF